MREPERVPELVHEHGERSTRPGAPVVVQPQPAASASREIGSPSASPSSRPARSAIDATLAIRAVSRPAPAHQARPRLARRDRRRIEPPSLTGAVAAVVAVSRVVVEDRDGTGAGPIVAPVGPERTTVNVSVDSAVLSPAIATVKVSEVTPR